MSQTLHCIDSSKAAFNQFFCEELYGIYDTEENIILSRGSWNDEFVRLPKMFSFCLNYTLSKNWVGYSDSLGHESTFRALARYANMLRPSAPYSEEQLALTLGNTFTIGILFRLLHQMHPNASVLTLTPFYPPILKSIGLQFSEIKFVSSLQDEQKIVRDISTMVELGQTKILFLNNFIGVDSKTYSVQFWTQIFKLAETNDLLVVIDEGMSFYPLQYPSNINSPNIIRLVSPSKKYGIPGMKLGFMVASQEIIDRYYDYASTHYGGPPSVFFLLSEFLYQFEYALTHPQPQQLFTELSENYHVPLLTIQDLFSDYIDALNENRVKMETNYFLLHQWYQQHQQYFSAAFFNNGINTIFVPRFEKKTCHDFFIHAITKHQVSFFPSICLGDVSDMAFRITCLEPTKLLQEGLKRLSCAFTDFNDI